MSRRYLFIVMIALASPVLATSVMAQTNQPGGYQGVSKPPQEDIVTTPDSQPIQPIAKPSAAVAAWPAPQQPVLQERNVPGSTVTEPIPDSAQQPPSPIYQGADPDGDIVHVRAARPGELVEGTTIQVRLIDRISSTDSTKGAPFRGQVASDVLQEGKVLIPAGSAIEGQVTSVSTGRIGGHGSFRLRPDAVILPDGSRFQLHAETTGTPGSKTRIGPEGSINPGSRAKKNGIEYGAVVGTGAVAGALLGGPVGAVTGSLVGAGIVTTHIMVDRPQATLEPGSILLFTLTEPMNLMPLPSN